MRASGPACVLCAGRPPLSPRISMQPFRHATRLLALAIAQCLSPAVQAQEPPAVPPPAAPVELDRVQVIGQAQDDRRAKLEHIMREVDGPRVTVTKKTSITKVQNLPAVVDNSLRNLFAQTPGLQLSEQQSPGQLNLNYRGIGNPQESEFVTVLLDGIPLEGDWVGYPTIYTFPPPQSLAEVQLIRGGSSLLYGPQPPPTVNLVSRKPVADRALAGYSENAIGSDGMRATFNQVSGTSGRWDYLVDV